MALKSNPHVPELLTGRPRRYEPDGFPGVIVGSPEEAATYAEHNREAWKAVPGALFWLKEAAKATAP